MCTLLDSRGVVRLSSWTSNKHVAVEAIGSGTLINNDPEPNGFVEGSAVRTNLDYSPPWLKHTRVLEQDVHQ